MSKQISMDATHVEETSASPEQAGFSAVSGSEVWVKFACAALVGEMASISLHDQPHLWRPKQAEHSAEMADAMMAEYRKRWAR